MLLVNIRHLPSDQSRKNSHRFAPIFNLLVRALQEGRDDPPYLFIDIPPDYARFAGGVRQTGNRFGANGN
jgi:hypothetical protein